MTRNGTGGIDPRTIVTWLIVGIAAILGLKLAMVALGVVTRFALFALFTLGPILLVGWLVLKLLRHFARDTTASTG